MVGQVKADSVPQTRKIHPIPHWLLVSAIASMGLERIDFFGGSGPFKLIPSVVILPLVAWAVFHRLWRRKVARHWSIARWGWVLLFALCGVALLSVLANSPNVLSLGRWSLLAIAMIGGWATISLAASSGDRPGVLKGAYIGLGIYVALSILQAVMSLFYGQSGPSFLGPVNVEVRPLGSQIIRLTGGSSDPNRAALVLATFVFLIICEPFSSQRMRPIWKGTIVLFATLLAFVTWSRSGIVAYLLIVFGSIVANVWDGARRKQIALVAISSVGILVFVIGLVNLFAPRFVQYVVSTRLSFSVGDSTDSHLGFFQLATEIISKHPILLVQGVGFGQSYRSIEATHPEMGTYGNFHSVYLTFLVETGLAGLILISALMFIPLFRQRFWLVAGIAVFGVFYQASSDSTFWMELAILWLLPHTTARQKAPYRRWRTISRRLKSRNAQLNTSAMS